MESSSTATPQLVVGFDLDMTLVDTRPGIKAVWDRVSEETGTFIDSSLAVSRLGPPLEQELAHWFPEERIPAAVDRYRELYPDLAITPSPALPGARAAVDAVHRAGGRVIVVTAKHQPTAKLHLEYLDIPVDAVIGWLWAEAKGEALREHGASLYVGDHLGDIAGARVAGARSVAVATGPIPATELRAAGADVVLNDLTEFPAMLADYLAESRPR
jgi:phosphoglycolate phosphatase